MHFTEALQMFTLIDERNIQFKVECIIFHFLNYKAFK